MQLMLTTEETRLLTHHLTQRLEHMETELLHTDKRELQRAIARDIEALRALVDRVGASTGATEMNQTRSAAV
jgi:hypothetical protein